MFRKSTFVIVACLFSVTVTAQEWVSFGSKAIGTPLEISVQQNNEQTVSFTVGLSGMFVESKTESSGVYKRLSMPECQTMGEVGSPEIPVITKMVAIPECSEVSVAVTMSGVQTFTNYVVYPVPDQQLRNNGDETFYMEEVFTKDAAVYGQNIAMPVESYTTLETGHLRLQRYMQLELHPVQYNPVTQTLTVATDMEITLTFVNATTPVNVGVGIFNNVAAKTMVNYVDQGVKATINDKAFEKPDFVKGNVQWITLTNPNQAKSIVADYVIICAGVFFNSHCEAIQELADHRAHYNGFDVAILNVDNIISLGFEYEGNPNDPDPQQWDLYKKEQRIRTCIRYIYEGSNAAHTMDGKLGYVLLVGKTEGGSRYNTGMPSSYDHIGQGTLCDGGSCFTDYASDYYFSCLTKKNDGTYEKGGDLYIGRFCVPNNLDTVDSPGYRAGLKRLQNMVTKTINYEKRFNPAFKKNVNLGYGGDLHLSAHYVGWKNLVNSYLQSHNLVGINAYDYDENSTIFGREIMNMLNSSFKGGLFDIYAHGGVQHWWGILYADFFRDSLENANAQPFCMSQSCLTGRFDNSPDDSHPLEFCLAEDITSYSDSMGFIGMLAATTLADKHTNGFHKKIPAAIYQNFSHVTGEFIFEAKAALLFDEAHKYNLFGDPALNIMAEGYVVERSTTLQEDTTNISCKISIVYGGNLIIPANKAIWLDNNGSITGEIGGKLTMNNGSQITSFAEHSPDRFVYLKSSFDGGSNAIIKNIHFQTASSVVNVNFDNVNFMRNDTRNASFLMKNCHFTNSSIWLNNQKNRADVTNCDFTDCTLHLLSSVGAVPIVMSFNNTKFTRTPINHKNHKLETTNCTFSDRSDVIASYPVTDISNCRFWESGFMATVPKGIIVGAFTPFVKVSGSSFGNTGQYITGYDVLEQPVYSSASIMLDWINEFEITGNTIININAVAPKDIGPGGGGDLQHSPQGEGIYLNNAGQGSANNQKIRNNEISQCETGLYIYNSKVQVTGSQIYDNQSGVRLFNNSQTIFAGYNDIIGYPDDRYQIIRDNSSYQLYASQGAFPTSFIYNTNQ